MGVGSKEGKSIKNIKTLDKTEPKMKLNHEKWMHITGEKTE